MDRDPMVALGICPASIVLSPAELRGLTDDDRACLRRFGATDRMIERLDDLAAADVDREVLIDFPRETVTVIV